MLSVVFFLAFAVAVEATKLYALAQDHSPAFPIAFTRRSSVFEIDVDDGSVRLVWNDTLQYGADFCAFAAPSFQNETLYLLTGSSSLKMIDMETGKSVRDIGVLSQDPPRWYSALAFDESNGRIEGICNASYGWPMGRQWFTIDMTTGKLTYSKALPLLDSSSLSPSCLFSSSLETNSSRLFWYLNENRQIIGFDVDNGSICFVGFANVLGFHYDPGREKMYGIKLSDGSFLPVVVTQVNLVGPDQKTPPEPPEKVLHYLPSNLTLAGAGVSVLDHVNQILYLLMSDQKKEGYLPPLPNMMAAVDMKSGNVTTKKLDFKSFTYLASNEFLFSRLFVNQ